MEGLIEGECRKSGNQPYTTSELAITRTCQRLHLLYFTPCGIIYSALWPGSTVKMPKMKSSRREAANPDFAERVIMMNNYGGPFC